MATKSTKNIFQKNLTNGQEYIILSLKCLNLIYKKWKLPLNMEKKLIWRLKRW